MRILISLLISVGVVFGQLAPQQSITFKQNPPGGVSGASVQKTGVGGSRTCYYWVVADFPIGSSDPTGPIPVNGCPDSFSVSNYVTVSWNVVSLATSYDVLRTTTNSFPSGTNSIAVIKNTTATSVNDQSDTLTTYTLNTAGAATAVLGLNNISYTTPMFEMTSNNITSQGGLITYPQFGFIQNTGTASAIYNSYQYFLQAPTYNRTAQNVFSNMWFDIGGFPAASLVGSSINTVPVESDSFRFTCNNIFGGRNNCLNSYIAVGGNSLTGNALYTQASAFGDAPFMYAANFHASGCEGFKCNGTTYPDHAPATLIGVEVDTEIRNAATHGIGVYNVCVNCLATGTSSAFLSDSQKSLQIGDPAHQPWTYAYNSAAGAAIHGMQLNPLLDPNENVGAAKSDSQDAQTCAYTDNLNPPTKECSIWYTTSNGVTQILAPESKVYLLNSAGNAISTLHSQLLANAYTAVGPTSLTNTTMEEFITNTGAAGVVNLTLPNTVVAGLRAYFFIAANQTMNISAGANTIQVGASTGTTVSSSTPGSNITIIGTSPTTWAVESALGVWALDSTLIINSLADHNWSSTAGGSTVATGITTYFTMGAAAPGTEGTRLWVVPRTATLTGLGCYMTTAATGTAGNTVVTLRKNLANTTITYNIPFGSVAGAFSDSSHTVSAAAGDRLAIQVANGTDGTTGSLAGFWVTYR